MASIEESKIPHRIPRKRSAGASLIGRQISISWPQDNGLYPARCVDYNPKTGLHKVLYYCDDSIEELLLSERKWHRNEEVRPELDPAGNYALIGHMIILPTMTRETASSAKTETEFLACVHEVIKQDAQILHQIVYVKSDFIATVDLSEVKYIVVDNVTGDVIRVVNEDKGLVQLDITMDDEEPPDDSRVRFEEETLAEGNASSASLSQGKEKALKDDATNATATSSKIVPAKACQDTDTTIATVAELPLDTPATPNMNQIADNDGITADASEQRGMTEKNFAFSAPLGPVDQHPSPGTPVSGAKVVPITGNQNEFVDNGDGGPSSPIMSNATMKTVSPVSQGNGGEACLTEARLTVADTPTLKGDAQNKGETKTLAPKIKRRRLKGTSKSQKALKYAIIRLKRHIAVKTDTSKYMRKAFVETYSQEDETHLVTFCDAFGGSMHIRLTKDNHRMLHRKEVEELIKRRASIEKKRVPQRSRADSSGGTSTSKRTSPAVAQSVPSPGDSSLPPSAAVPNGELQTVREDVVTRSAANPSPGSAAEQANASGIPEDYVASGSVLGKRSREYSKIKEQLLHELLERLEKPNATADKIQSNLLISKMETETALVETIIAHRKLQKSLAGDNTPESLRLRAANNVALAELGSHLETMRNQ